MNSCVYNGLVTHTRFKPVKHFLKYKTFSLLLDLDEIEKLDKKISIFSFNKFNIYSFYNKDHGNRDGYCLKKWVFNNLKNNGVKHKISKIRLLCYPRILGYVFNPLSVFYCYEEKKLKMVLYEVKNTFNEQHTYIFKTGRKKDIKHNCKKKFYVSPFMDMNTHYHFKLSNPDKKLFISIKQTDTKGIVLTATQSGKKRDLNLKQLLLNFFGYPLMTAKIISAIHYEAFILWIKGAIYRSRKRKIKIGLSYEEKK